MKENIWYGWNGGDCPVHPDTMIRVVLRCYVNKSETPYDVTTPYDVKRAGDMRWTQTDRLGDVVLFMILPVKKEFIVDKWYQDNGGYWRKIIASKDGYVWITEPNFENCACDWLIETAEENINWSVPPQDEHP